MNRNNNNGATIDIRTLDSFVCGCGGTVFTKASEIKRLPAIVSPNGQSGVVFYEHYAVCVNCGTTWDQEEIKRTLEQEAVKAPIVEVVKS